MNDSVELNEDSLCGLFRKRYRYYLLGNILTLDYYSEDERRTKRHKFRAVKLWTRLNGRASTMDRPIVRRDIRVAVIDRFLSEMAGKIKVEP